MNERIDAFLAYLRGERSLSPNTISAYRNDLLQFAEYLQAEAELVMVDVGDVSFENRQVRVVGRGNRERTLPLDQATANSIRLYLETARPYLTRNAPHETALVVNQRGLRLTRQGFWLIMKGL